MDDSTFLAWVGLGMIQRVGVTMLNRLLEVFGSPSAILAASEDDLLAVKGVGKQTTAQILQVNLDFVARQVKQWQKSGIQIFTWQSDLYPALLKMIESPPVLLFVHGNLDAADARIIAIVGTRQPSSQAEQFTQLLSVMLAKENWIIISGLAYGIDTAAHSGTLAAGGETVAVLGSGLNNIYPPENQPLAKRIMNQGALISEVHPMANPHSANLVSRNRIISGLSQAVIMIESSQSGGAMHTVRFAQRQNRLVYTVDFPAAGNRTLVKSGIIAISPDLVGIEQLITMLPEDND